MPSAAALAEFQIKLNMKEMTTLEGKIMTMERQGRASGKAYTDAKNRLKVVTEATRGWQRKYFNLTGVRWVSYTMPAWDVADQYRKEQAKKDAAAMAQTKKVVHRQVTFAYSERIREVEQKLSLLVANVNSAKNPLLQIKKNATGKEIADKAVQEVGFGFTENFMILERVIPWDVENKLIPKIRTEIAAAKRAYDRERKTSSLKETHRHLMAAAKLLNQGMAAMSKYSNAVQRSGNIAIAYIKWGSIVVTGAVTGGASGLAAVGLGVTQKTAEEGTTLAARWACGEKLTKEDVKKAIAEIALAGATSSAGEIAGSFAGPVAKKIFGAGVTKAQIKTVGGVLTKVVANNFEQALKALANYMNGKPVEWNYWASLVSPLLPTPAGAALKEDDVRPVVTKQCFTCKGRGKIEGRTCHTCSGTGKR